jgi:hypothetical protein
MVAVLDGVDADVGVGVSVYSAKKQERNQNALYSLDVK